MMEKVMDILDYTKRYDSTEYTKKAVTKDDNIMIKLCLYFKLTVNFSQTLYRFNSTVL